MTRLKALAAGFALLLLTFTADAQTNAGVQACGADSDSVYCLCRDGRQKPDASVFSDLAAAAVAVRKQFCSGLLSRDAVSALVLDFVSDNGGWEAEVGGFNGDLSTALIEESTAAGGPIGLTNAFVNDDDEVTVRVGSRRFVVNDVATCA